MHRRWRAGWLMVVVLLIGSGCSGAVPPTPGPTAAPLPTDAVAGLADLDLTIEGGPDFPVAAFGSLWLFRADLADPAITRLDPATGAVMAEIAVGDAQCQATGASDTAIWACSPNGLIRVDPATNRADGEIAVAIGRYYGHLPFGAGSIWAVGGTVVSADTLLRIDPEAMRVVETVPLGFNAGDLAFDFGALWITDPVAGKLVRYDPASGTLTDHVTGLTAPRALATGFGSVWVGLYDSRDMDRPEAGTPTLARVDPVAGNVVASIAVASDPVETCLLAGTAGLWVRSGEPYLALIDPGTNTVVKRVDSDNPTGCAIEIDGRLWVISIEFQKVWRLRAGAP